MPRIRRTVAERWEGVPPNAALTWAYHECGKRCNGCPHGPYLRAEWRVKRKDGTWTVKTRYLGKNPL